MSKKISCFLLVMSFLTMMSCGSDDSGDDLANEQIPQEESVNDFSTRLNNNLLIAGTKCNGGETTEYEGQTYNCEEDQWLIQVDNINSCDDAGRCTEVGVVPFIAELDRTDIISIPEYTFFMIDPITPITTDQRNAVRDVWVRFDLNDDEATVVFR